jgi:hypothetical protein
VKQGLHLDAGDAIADPKIYMDQFLRTKQENTEGRRSLRCNKFANLALATT